MTVQSAASRNSYTASGGTTFAYTFLAQQSTDLAVYDAGTLVATSAYTVTGTGSATGGSVIFTVAPTAGHSIIILSAAAYTQGADLVDNDPFAAATMEGALDRNTILSKQLKEITDRAPKFIPTSSTSGITFPEPLANYYVGWNAAGSDLENKAVVATSGTVTVPAFTAGSVVFASAAATLSQDNASFFWDSVLRRLGLGTAVPSAFRVTATTTGTDGGLLAIINGAAGGIGVEALSASTTSPAVVGGATAYYGGLFYNITDLGSDLANANAIGLVGQSVYSNAGYMQQGAVSGPGSTLARNNVYPAFYVTRVVSNLNGFNYTAPLLRLDDTTASTGILMDARRQNTCVMYLMANGRAAFGTAQQPTASINFEFDPPDVNGAFIIYNSAMAADGGSIPLMLAGRNAAGTIGNVSLEAVTDTGVLTRPDLVVRVGGTSQVAFGTELMRFTCDRNVKIGGSAKRATTEGTFKLDIFNGTAPVGTLANGISLYATAGELRVMDSGGTATLLSPHDEQGEWVFDSTDTATGRRLLIQMERMMKRLNAHFGWDYVKES